MRAIIVAVLLMGCARAEEGTSIQKPVPVQDPADLVGYWCDADLCLQVNTTSYGPNWLVYSWKSSECQEGGFIEENKSGQLMFSAFDFNMTGCFSKLTTDRYTATFALVGDDELMAQLSVLDHQLFLVRGQQQSQ